MTIHNSVMNFMQTLATSLFLPCKLIKYAELLQACV